MGATNFLTGAGGFLQSILNGYAGIRMFIGRMEINHPRLPTNTIGLSISGIYNINTNNDVVVFKLTFLTRNKKKITTRRYLLYGIAIGY